MRMARNERNSKECIERHEGVIKNEGTEKSEREIPDSRKYVRNAQMERDTRIKRASG